MPASTGSFTQVPPWQAPPVHLLPSFTGAAPWHLPSMLLQVPAVWHSSGGAQTISSPMHALRWHTALTVHGSSAVHLRPSFLARSAHLPVSGTQ